MTDDLSMKKGFTLVELLIVVSVMSVLILVVLTVLDPLGQLQKGRDTQRKNDLTQIQRMLDAYYSDNNRYPVSTGDPSYQISGVSWGGMWSPYGRIVPKDPLSTQSYAYIADTNGVWYKLYVKLEKGANDPRYCGGCGPGNAYHYVLTSSNCFSSIGCTSP